MDLMEGEMRPGSDMDTGARSPRRCIVYTRGEGEWASVVYIQSLFSQGAEILTARESLPGKFCHFQGYDIQACGFSALRAVTQLCCLPS